MLYTVYQILPKIYQPVWALFSKFNICGIGWRSSQRCTYFVQPDGDGKLYKRSISSRLGL